MGFVVLHMEKAHGSDSGTTAHIERFIIPKNADPTRTHLNRRLIEYPDGVKDRSCLLYTSEFDIGLERFDGLQCFFIHCVGRRSRRHTVVFGFDPDAVFSVRFTRR